VFHSFNHFVNTSETESHFVNHSVRQTHYNVQSNCVTHNNVQSPRKIGDLTSAAWAGLVPVSFYILFYDLFYILIFVLFCSIKTINYLALQRPGSEGFPFLLGNWSSDNLWIQLLTYH
jgi:hypothetical protein